MPNISLVPVPHFSPLSPYHFTTDNLPIEGLETQIYLVNSQVDINQNDIEGSIGTAGTLANRLNQSLEESGDLKAAAIDEALHSIAEHADEGGFVRMTDAERTKLSSIEDESTKLNISLESISSTLLWPEIDDTFSLYDSDTIAWRYAGGNVYADTTFSKSLITTKNYNVNPVNVSGNINFKTSSINTAYVAGSLRVYVNGLRLCKNSTPIGGFYFTEDDPTIGTFDLNTALESGDVIRIDFDQPLS